MSKQRTVGQWTRRGLKAGAAALLGVLLSAGAGHGQIATQLVTFEVQAVNQLSVSGNPPPLVVSAATAGSGPSTVSSSATTWAVTTNETGKKITAEIDTDMPTGVTLTVSLQAPGSATSAGATPLSTTPVDLVSGIDTVSASNLMITYELSATANAGTVASSSRTVTFTLVAGS